MPASASGPGKTAPKLHNDFLNFDPRKANAHINFLTDLPPPVGDGPQLAPERGSCKHEYRTKWSQSVPPPLDLRPDGGTEYKIAAVCKKCRIHAEVHVAFPATVNPCPNTDYPLHHFQRVPGIDKQTPDRILYGWQCSAPDCRAQLGITFRLPRLATEDITLLTDTEQLKRRYEAVVEEDPMREGLRQASPTDTVTRLKKYIKDSLDTAHTRRTFPANNKRFMEAFGVYGRDCAPLLQRLGFIYSEENQSWTLPQPPELENRLRTDGNSHRELLEDIELELLSISYRLAADTNAINPSAAEGWPSADRDIERALAAQGYQRNPAFRRPANDELPYFASLGILPDFADDLVEYGFDRQILCDPERRSYYFECLQVITDSRNTEQLQMKVATLASQDFISRRDVRAAYRQLDISQADAERIDDERVLNLFHVRVSDLGATGQDEARHALLKIGISRGSQKLIKASRQTMETYEDALAWLGNGADKNTPDEMLLSLVAIKTSDSKDNEERAQAAISIIAKERKSNVLNNWVLTGRTDGYEMSPDEALRHLGQEVNFNNIDSSHLSSIFTVARADRPGEQTEKAIAVLQQALSGNSAMASHPPEEWPVGLTSHGNTCYLNSLLQYYFSVAPLRNIILNYDKYKFDTSKYAEKSEHVGRTSITPVEIKGGQVFAQDLKHLFERMIKDPGTQVKPVTELVCRAFLPLKDYALLAAQGTEANGLESAVEEPLPDATPPSAQVEGEDRNQSDASSVTLQAESTNGEKEDVPMQNGETPATPPASPGRENADDQQQTTAAPPLPPRRFSTTREQALAKVEEKAREQHDVAEVHDQIMFRLRVGMKPRGMDEWKEQMDAIQEIFNIRSTRTRVKDGKDMPAQNDASTSIQLYVHTEASDLYSELDATFDLQGRGELEGEVIESYDSLTALPPILQISTPRLAFGASGGYKTDVPLRLEEILYMDRYTDQPDILPKRRACWGWRKRLHALKKERKALSTTATDLDGPTAVHVTANYLNGLSSVNEDFESIGMDGIEIDPELSAALAADAEQQKLRLTSLDDEIKTLEQLLDGQFTEDTKLKYRLAAVLFHRGSAGSGHYWAYIHDFEKDMWRNYNDETVTEFDKGRMNEILHANTWMHGTPAYAVYVRDDMKSELIQPICREPEKLPEPVWDDVSWPNGESQSAAPVSCVDPRETVKEGGDSSWDDQREVAQVSCPGNFRPLVDLKVGSKLTIRNMPPPCSDAQRDGSISPKRRHDSTNSEGSGSPLKQIKLSDAAMVVLAKVAEGWDEAKRKRKDFDEMIKKK